MGNGRRILKNLFSLTLAEIAGKGISVITFIYLARILKPEGLGIYSFGASFVAYFLLIVNLGFDTYGAREVAKFPDKKSKYLNSIIIIRLALALISFLFLLLTTVLLNKPLLVKYVILINSIQLLGAALLIIWLYTGLERMEFIALRQILTGLLNLVGVLLLVRDDKDILLAAAVSSVAFIINAAWLLIAYVKIYGKFKFELDYPFLKEVFKHGLTIGLIFLIIVINNNLSIVMLGFMGSNAEVGIFTAPNKIVILAYVPSMILQQSFYPLFSRTETLEDRIKIMNKFTLLLALTGTSISFFIFTFSTPIIHYSLGNLFSQSDILLKIMSGTIFLVHISVNSVCPVIAWKGEKKVLYIMIISGSVNIVANLILIPAFHAMGAALTTILSELVISIGSTILAYKILRKLFLKQYLLIIIITVFSCLLGFIIQFLKINPFIAAFVFLFTFVVIIFAFKIVSLTEIRGYLKK